MSVAPKPRAKRKKPRALPQTLPGEMEQVTPEQLAEMKAQQHQKAAARRARIAKHNAKAVDIAPKPDINDFEPAQKVEEGSSLDDLRDQLLSRPFLTDIADEWGEMNAIADEAKAAELAEAKQVVDAALADLKDNPALLASPAFQDAVKVLGTDMASTFEYFHKIIQAKPSSVPIKVIRAMFEDTGGNGEQPDPAANKKGGADKDKDSLLSKAIAVKLADTLVFDEVSLDWYLCKNGIWQPTTKTSGLKIINECLHEMLPLGFSMHKLSSVEAFLRLYLSLDKWEVAQHLLPLKNGILNTQTMELVAYSPAYRFRWQLPYDYNPAEQITIIGQWLEDVTQNDLEAINIIRAFLRLAVCGGEVQKFLEVIGPGGTGKSTLVRLMTLLLGESNFAATDLKNLESNRFEAATLYGKRLAVISDSGRYGGEVSVLKAITGGDPVRHERKNQQQSGSFVFDGVVVIAANEPIQSTDYTSGLARRRLPLMFKRKVTDADKEKWRPYGGIEAAMKKELSGLLNWVLAMPSKDINAVIGSINSSMTQVQREHYCETNKLAQWIDDNLVIDESSVMYLGGSSKGEDSFDKNQQCTTKLYPNYERWCVGNGVNAVAVQRFTSNLMDVCEHAKLPVVSLKRDMKGNRVKGLALRESSKRFDTNPTPITKKMLTNVEDMLTEVVDYVKHVNDVDKTQSKVFSNGFNGGICI